MPFVWATGKAPRARWVPGTLATLGGAPRPGVYLQGAIVEDAAGRELYSARLPVDVVIVAAELAAALEATLAVYTSDGPGGEHAILTSTADARTARLDTYGKPLCRPVPDVAAAAASAGRVHKLILLHEDADVLTDARGAINELLGGAVSTTAALSGMLEILPPGVDKGDGVLRLLGELGGVDPETVLALGDGDNDGPLLALAGFGVAVGNAGEVARAAASVVLDETHDQDAVAVAIERFVLAAR